MKRTLFAHAATGLAAALLGGVFGAWLVTEWYDVPLDPAAFRFERPWAATLLVGPLLVWAAHWLQRHEAPRLLVSRGAELARLAPSWRALLSRNAINLRICALVLLVGGLMGPQSIHARERTEVEGIDIMLALDMSLSMQAADIPPSRFEATQQVVDDFISRRPSDRMGAVVFGRDAYTLLPLTTDKQALRAAVSELGLGMIDGRATAIGNAVGVALNRLRRSEAKTRILILLTDGDSNSGNLSPDQAASIAKELGIRIYTILIGRRLSPRSAGLLDRMLGDRGNFPVNPALLERMAKTTGGEHFSVGDRQGLEQSFHVILDRLERSDIEDPGRVYAELFPALLAPALCLLMLELLIVTVVVRRWP